MSAADFPDVVATSGEYRARIVHDLNAESPALSDAGFVSVFAPLTRRGLFVGNASSATGQAIGQAVENYGGGGPAAIRYLRVFHGVDAVAADIGVYREYMPVLAAVDAEAAEAAGVTPDKYAEALAGDIAAYRQWSEGDVWGVIVERALIWRQDGNPSETLTTWEECRAVWGHYGEEYARQAAAELLAEVAAE